MQANLQYDRLISKTLQKQCCMHFLVLCIQVNIVQLKLCVKYDWLQSLENVSWEVFCEEKMFINNEVRRIQAET